LTVLGTTEENCNKASGDKGILFSGEDKIKISKISFKLFLVVKSIAKYIIYIK